MYSIDPWPLWVGEGVFQKQVHLVGPGTPAQEVVVVVADSSKREIVGERVGSEVGLELAEEWVVFGEQDHAARMFSGGSVVGTRGDHESPVGGVNVAIVNEQAGPVGGVPVGDELFWVGERNAVDRGEFTTGLELDATLPPIDRFAADDGIVVDLVVVEIFQAEAGVFELELFDLTGDRRVESQIVDVFEVLRPSG